MKRWQTLVLATAGAVLVGGTALFTPGCLCLGPQVRRSPTEVSKVDYHGWSGALRLTNDFAEVVVVPEIGRVMSFRLLDGANVFWEDCSLDGKRGDAGGREWVNFGGDKTWPAPESEWRRQTGNKQWMPPPAFDALPAEGVARVSEVMLTSPVDPFYGIRTVRVIRLWGQTMNITTTYEKVSGEPVKAGIWTITQFKDPVMVAVPLPPRTIFTNGYFTFTEGPWPHLEKKGRHLEITRDPKLPRKMGCDARTMAWIGEKEICVVNAVLGGGTEFPDRGASAEVYTNPDPKKYVELETLGPLALLNPGDRISHTVHYTLHRRTSQKPDEQLPWLFP
jgi:hypothetical protein